MILKKERKTKKKKNKTKSWSGPFSIVKERLRLLCVLQGRGQFEPELARRAACGMSGHERETVPQETLFEDALQTNSSGLGQGTRQNESAADSSKDSRTRRRRRLEREQTSQEAEVIAREKLDRGLVSQDEFEQIASTLARARNVSCSSFSEDDDSGGGSGEADRFGFLEQMVSDTARGGRRDNDDVKAAVLGDLVDSEELLSAQSSDVEDASPPDSSSGRPQSKFVERTAVIEFLNTTLSAIKRRTLERKQPPSKLSDVKRHTTQQHHGERRERPAASPKHNSISSFCEVRVFVIYC